MLELARPLAERAAAGRPLAVATVVAIDGSAPRAVGATMFVDADGAVVGSISGGCVEGAVVEACHAVLDGADPAVVRYGISDEAAMGVGLMCGGDLDVYIERLPAGDRPALAAARDGAAVSVGTIIAGPRGLIGTRVAELTDAQLRDSGAENISAARIRAEHDAHARSGRSVTWHIQCGPIELSVFTDVAVVAPRLLIFGAVDFSAALADAGRLLGYHVTVCDARAVFATPERFPGAHEVVSAWPHVYLARTAVDERTVVCVLTHDLKFDVPLLELALALPVAYVGAMGSRRTHARRVRALREHGVPEVNLERLRSPIGLDIGASTPAETAVSILAEVIAVREGASGRSLSGTDGPIHRDHAPNEPASLHTRSRPIGSV
ncbi:XdhC family protein [Leifsonia sp. AG29]|uniref:XdhC family protein n=1 Tax=Leifsonia sp. AG29 TaxID=2598860 RepID=UPI00131DB6FF|nr:XdhC/CoxI family protein [Leifsonia sp. AG29]